MTTTYERLIEDTHPINTAGIRDLLGVTPDTIKRLRRSSTDHVALRLARIADEDGGPTLAQALGCSHVNHLTITADQAAVLGIHLTHPHHLPLPDSSGDGDAWPYGQAPDPLPRGRLWRTGRIAQWAMQTGRLNPMTGEPQRSKPTGRPRGT